MFNKVDVDKPVTDEFAALFGLAEAEKSCVVKPQATIYANEVFERLKAVGKSLGDITSDETDCRALARSEGRGRERAMRSHGCVEAPGSHREQEPRHVYSALFSRA